LIEERLVLSKEILKEGEILKHEIQSHLELTEKSQIGGTEIAIEKNNLRHKKIEIAELQLNEKLNCWKDISELKKERRIAEKELFEKKERAKMFEKLMENSENANAK
jgi:DNA mismatch repair ATPase MutS